jgi:uncharacterized protein (TIGR02266 family)
MLRKPSFSERPGAFAAPMDVADCDSLPQESTPSSHHAVAVQSRIPIPRASGTVARADRRGNARVEVDLDVSLGTESHYFSARAEDLSCGGLFIATYRVLELGTELSVEFDLPAGRVMAKGIVRWSRDAHDGQDPGYGVAFLGLARFDGRLIESFCQGQLEPCEAPALAG